MTAVIFIAIAGIFATTGVTSTVIVTVSNYT
jgi:hypothetical protein